VFAWETALGYAVHVLNYNNPNMTRGWIRKHNPIGPQQVRMELPAGVRISRVELLRAGRVAKHSQTGRVVEFAIPGVLDYEVAALHRA
jgi:hypothetical protein